MVSASQFVAILLYASPSPPQQQPRLQSPIKALILLCSKGLIFHVSVLYILLADDLVHVSGILQKTANIGEGQHVESMQAKY